MKTRRRPNTEGIGYNGVMPAAVPGATFRFRIHAMRNEFDEVQIEQVFNTLAEQRDSADIELITRAYEFARESHEGQKRLTGAPYIQHPVAVANIVAELGMDDASVCAGLLHDVVEDCRVSLDDLQERFGDPITRIVNGVTKITRIDFRSKKRAQAENMRKMILAMAEDIRVIIVKLGDRLHNISTLDPFPPEKQKDIAEETLHIFAPLAHRLGIQRIKWQLEDKAFRYLQPDEYRAVVRKVNKTRRQRVHEVDEVIEILKQRLTGEGIEAEIQGRPKHLYSIYTKMLKQDIDFDRIHDLMAIRVIVNTVRDCYAALGVVQNLWMPLPGMFTDYIAKPKPNRYQSLHTKVLGPRNETVEVQIRTWDMHREAEYGIAAHWQYKEGISPGTRLAEDRRGWMRQLIHLHSDMHNDEEFLESLRLDLFKDEVFVFTPAGDVIDLPVGGTPVDFAYRVHTQIGHSCAGAKVNGRLVPLDYQLQNGDICEILTSKHAKPRASWLRFVRTSHAKGRIKSALRKQDFEDNLVQGRQRLEREAHTAGLDWTAVVKSGLLEGLAAAANYKSVDEYLAAVGYGDFSAEGVIDRIRLELSQETEPEHKPPPKDVPSRGDRQTSVGVKTEGGEELLFRLSRCCSPVPGDPIVGYVTRGRGVTIHRRSCPNIRHYRQNEPGRLLEVDWDPQEGATYRARLELEAFDRVGLLNDVTSIITSHRTNITHAEVTTSADGGAKLKLELAVDHLNRLQGVMRELRQLSDVRRVRRVNA